MAHGESPIDHVLEEVQDTNHWVFFKDLFGGFDVNLPAIPIPGTHYHIQLTKYMVLEVVAALLIIFIFVPLARRIQSGELPRGRWWNFFETLLLFVRDQIVRPNLDNPHPHHADHGHGEHGHGEHTHHAEHAHHAAHPPVEQHEGDKYLPFMWTLFLFILLLNLLGLIPFLGSATASIWVTGSLAVISFLMMHGAALKEKHWNYKAYFASLWPHIDVPYVGWLFSGGIFAIEMLGTGIKAFVLCVRLFANMIAGHMVLGMILLFIYMVGTKEPAAYALWAGVSVASVLGVLALSLLELFVAFLQAYVFVFLTALFMGMSLYPEH